MTFALTLAARRLVFLDVPLGELVGGVVGGVTAGGGVGGGTTATTFTTVPTLPAASTALTP